MNNIEVINSYMRLISFKPDGMYNLGYYNNYRINVASISDEEIEAMKSKIQIICSPIIDGDILLFKNSSFPKLFLKEIGSKVTRTIKETKATRIVTDSINILRKEDLENIEPCTIAKNSEGEYYMIDMDSVTRNNINLNKFLLDNSLELMENTKLVPNTLTDKKIEILDNYEKLATTEQLVEYVNNFLPLPTHEQKETLLALLKSSEVSNIELGINMLRMFNISDCIFDVYQALAGDDLWYGGKNLADVNRANVRWKYLMSLGDFKISDFRSFNRTWHNISSKIYNIYSLPFISLEQKKKCWLHVYCTQNYNRVEQKDKIFAMSEFEKFKLSDSNMTKYGFPAKYADIS